MFPVLQKDALLRLRKRRWAVSCTLLYQGPCQSSFLGIALPFHGFFRLKLQQMAVQK
jgi:hypothetical protein